MYSDIWYDVLGCKVLGSKNWLTSREASAAFILRWSELFFTSRKTRPGPVSLHRGNQVHQLTNNVLILVIRVVWLELSWRHLSRVKLIDSRAAGSDCILPRPTSLKVRARWRQPARFPAHVQLGDKSTHVVWTLKSELLGVSRQGRPENSCATRPENP